MTVLPANETTEPETFWNEDYPRSDDEALMLWGLATEPATTLDITEDQVPF